MNGLKMKYACPASPPEGIYLDRVYTLNVSNNGNYVFTDGNYEEKVSKDNFWYIKMLFKPIDSTWDEVESSK